MITKKKFFIGLGILTLVMLIAAWRYYKHTTSAINPFKVEQPTKRTITQYINATGNLRARDPVAVGSLVTGKVTDIYADDNDLVKEGQLLCIIDDGVGDSDIKKLKANLKEAKENLTYQKKFFTRQKALYQAKQISQNIFDKYTQDYENAKNKVEQTEADLEKATKTYNNLFIKSPANGIVTAKKIDLGQMVASQLQATVLYEIAKDLHYMEDWVDVDEADIGLVEQGQDAVFTVDAFPKRQYTGKVKRIQYQAKMIDNVVTYATILDASNADLTLRPGMTTTVDIKVAHQDNILSMPNKALRVGTMGLEETAKQNGYIIEKVLEDITIAKSRSEKSGGKASRSRKDFVWILEGNKVRQTIVELGITDGKFTEIKQGLNENSSIITEITDVKRDNLLLKGIFGKPGGIGNK
jgi:HlyD family secretion protein